MKYKREGLAIIVCVIAIILAIKVVQISVSEIKDLNTEIHMSLNNTRNVIRKDTSAVKYDYTGTENMISNRSLEQNGKYYAIIEDISENNPNVITDFSNINSSSSENTADSDYEGDAAASIITYDYFKYYPSVYSGLYIAVTGRVVQVDEFVEGKDTKYNVRLAQSGNADEIWKFTCIKDDVILKGDLLTVYGSFDNSNCYINNAGLTICNPSIIVSDMYFTDSLNTEIKEESKTAESPVPKTSSKGKASWGI